MSAARATTSATARADRQRLRFRLAPELLVKDRVVDEIYPPPPPPPPPVVVCCTTVVWVAVVEKTGVVVVWVTVAVLAAVVLVAAPVVVEVFVCVREALAFNGGTGALDCGPDTVASAPVCESTAASDPDRAGAELDFTALPMPKPAAIAITSSTPSSHHRCFMSRHPFTRFHP
jgi:hypothetical protein